MNGQPSTKPRGPGRPFSTRMRLGKVLVAKGYTQTYSLAAECGIPPRIFSDYLAGRRPIREAHLQRLSEVLEIPGKELVG